MASMDRVEGGLGMWNNFTGPNITPVYLFQVWLNGAPLLQVKVTSTLVGGPGLPSKWRVTSIYYAAASSGGANSPITVVVNDPYPDFFDGTEDQAIITARSAFPMHLWEAWFRTSTMVTPSGPYQSDGEIHVTAGGVSVLSVTGLFLNFDVSSAQSLTFTFGIASDMRRCWGTQKGEFLTPADDDAVPSSLNLEFHEDWASGTIDGWTLTNVHVSGAALGAPPYWWHHPEGLSVYSTPLSSPVVPAGGPGSRSLNSGVTRTFTPTFVVEDAGDDEDIPTGGGSTPCCAGPAGAPGTGSGGGTGATGPSGGAGCCSHPSGSGSGPGSSGPGTPAGPGEGNTGSNPNPVGVLPPWTRSCIGGGAVDSVVDLTDAESWA